MQPPLTADAPSLPRQKAFETKIFLGGVHWSVAIAAAFVRLDDAVVVVGSCLFVLMLQHFCLCEEQAYGKSI